MERFNGIDFIALQSFPYVRHRTTLISATKFVVCYVNIYFNFMESHIYIKVAEKLEKCTTQTQIGFEAL